MLDIHAHIWATVQRNNAVLAVWSGHGVLKREVLGLFRGMTTISSGLAGTIPEACERARRIRIHLSSRFGRFLSMEENRQQSHQVLVDRSSIQILEWCCCP